MSSEILFEPEFEVARSDPERTRAGIKFDCGLEEDERYRSGVLPDLVQHG